MEMLDWFEFNGVRCTDYGMHVLQQPQITSPSERLNTETIPGRPGTLTILEGKHIYDNLTLSCDCVIDNPYEDAGNHVSRISKITGWLKGSGNVKFANRQEGFYKARLSNQIAFDKIVRGNPHMSFQVQFTCDPFFYLDSGTTPIVCTDESTTLMNDGNVFSLPLLKIIGTGEGTIMCGGSSMLLSDISDLNYIMLDCEAKIAYQGKRADPEDPLKLLGTRVTGEWLNIPAGRAFFTKTGNLTSVEITPRWRCV